MTDLRKVLSINLKHHRKRLGISQAKLAELVSASDNHIALIETGRRFPSISMLEQLASAMQIDVLELFSIKSIELMEKTRVKKLILEDIENILSVRLLNKVN